MHSTLTINVPNIIRNYKSIREYVGEDVNVACVVKCDCYGLGMEQIALKIFNGGCKEFYVSELREGLHLRGLLPTAKIYVLHGIEHGQEMEFLDAKLIPVLNNLYQIKIWTEVSKKIEKRLECSLHIDSGMMRIGIDCHIAEDVLNSILSEDTLEICYVLSHLACADDIDNKKNKLQLEFVESLKKKYPKLKYSFSNSAGILLGKEYHFDQVRPGIMLYGVSPYNGKSEALPINLLPVVRLISKIIDIHGVIDKNMQQSIGYGATFKLEPGMTTATIPVGYGDGYARALSNQGYCYINGNRVNIIGNISMDLISIDISTIPAIDQRIGQEVELIGGSISIGEIANLAKTISHEILTSLGKRYARIYSGD
jgi:alanine racemase